MRSRTEPSIAFASADAASGPSAPSNARAETPEQDVMYSLSAILKAKPGQEHILQRALHDIVAFVETNEPGTIEYYVAQDTSDPTIYTTYERYISQAAMDAHNNSAECAEFYRVVNPVLAEKVILIKAREQVAKQVDKQVAKTG